MALDEVLFRESGKSGVALARFYRWSGAGVTFGYSTRANTIREKDAVRRFTGGGKVEHGGDLTFLLAIPAPHPIAGATAVRRYRWIHTALAKALKEAGLPVELETPNPESSEGPCFQNPVGWDLLDPTSRQKIGGGAQRRTREGIIHQGSIRLPDAYGAPDAEWIDHFLALISTAAAPYPKQKMKTAIEAAEHLEKTRYATPEWNGRR